MRPPSSRLLGLSAFLGIGAFVSLVVLGARTLDTVPGALVASLAAALTVILVVERPVAAVGLLFVLGSLSGILVDLPIGRVRLEQPSIIAALITLTVTSGWPRRSALRPVLSVAALFGIYLLVLTLASALNAPKPIVSARMIIWTILSMAGGCAAFALLVRPGAEGIESWFTGSGVGHALLGLAIAAAFLLIGPTGIPGMQTSPGEVPKVAGLAFEANLFASLLGGIAPFALDRFRTRPGLGTASQAILVVAAMGLGVTRGAYLGLAAGLLVYAGVLVYRRPKRQVLALLPVIALALVLAPSIARITLPTTRGTGTAVVTPGPTAGASPATSASPSRGSPAPSATPAPTPASTPAPTPVVNTFDYRVDRIPTALNDLRTSPIIGLGAATYGQRHHLLYESAGLPDYIGILALVAVYESGLLGASALALGFLLSLWLLFRLSRDRPGPAAAYAASLVSLLVAYQATNALFFSINWIILGAGLAFAVRTTGAGAPQSP